MIEVRPIAYVMSLISSLLMLGALAAQAPDGVQEGTAPVLPRLLDLGSKKCIPCKKMAPILEELQADFALIFETQFIDVWLKENSAASAHYKIEQIPTQIFFDSSGKELWRHEGFLSREAILAKWAELGVQVDRDQPVERWSPVEKDVRPALGTCFLCGESVGDRSKVTVPAEKAAVNLCSPHHLFVLLSCLEKGTDQVESSATVTDWPTGEMIPAVSAAYLYGLDTESGRPTVMAFADRAGAIAARRDSGGNIIGYPVLKAKELACRCGFCDRAVYPVDAAVVKVEGVHTWGCCAHCAMGVAARTGKDIEVRQPDGLTGEVITVKTRDGQIASIEPENAVAWFGMRSAPGGKWQSAGCFHQGFFSSPANLLGWLREHPLATGKQISIAQSLQDKMQLRPEQIQKACKIEECP